MDEATLLIAAQHVRGIPTWQDLANLDEEPLGQALRDALRDPSLANGLIWITRDLPDSDPIRVLEIPELMKRHSQGDGFFVVPVAADSLGYDQAGAAANRAAIPDDVRGWDIERVDSNPLSTADAAKVANRVLLRRLRAIDQSLAPGQPLSVVLHTRAPAVQPGIALTMDWSHLFEGRICLVDDWEGQIQPAMSDVVGALRAHAGARPVVASGLASIPAGILFGSAFLAPGALQLTWRQSHFELPDQEWSLSVPPEDSYFSARLFDEGPLDSRHLAVLVSVTEDTEPAFAASRESLPPFRARLVIHKDGRPPHLVSTPGRAKAIALMVAQEIRSAQREIRTIEQTHLFLAVPLGLAVLIGQLLNTLGPIQTYEHLPIDGVGVYAPAVLLTPGA